MHHILAANTSIPFSSPKKLMHDPTANYDFEEGAAFTAGILRSRCFQSHQQSCCPNRQVFQRRFHAHIRQRSVGHLRSQSHSEVLQSPETDLAICQGAMVQRVTEVHVLGWRSAHQRSQEGPGESSDHHTVGSRPKEFAGDIEGY